MSEHDTTDEKKPIRRTMGPPVGGIALFGSNNAVFNEMQGRLRKSRAPSEEEEHEQAATSPDKTTSVTTSPSASITDNMSTSRSSPISPAGDFTSPSSSASWTVSKRGRVRKPTTRPPSYSTKHPSYALPDDDKLKGFFPSHVTPISPAGRPTSGGIPDLDEGKEKQLEMQQMKCHQPELAATSVPIQDHAIQTKEVVEAQNEAEERIERAKCNSLFVGPTEAGKLSDKKDKDTGKTSPPTRLSPEEMDEQVNDGEEIELEGSSITEQYLTSKEEGGVQTRGEEELPGNFAEEDSITPNESGQSKQTTMGKVELEKNEVTGHRSHTSEIDEGSQPQETNTLMKV